MSNSLSNFKFSTIGKPPALLQRLRDSSQVAQDPLPSPPLPEPVHVSTKTHQLPSSRPSLIDALVSEKSQESSSGSNKILSPTIPAPLLARQPLSAPGHATSLSTDLFSNPPPALSSQSLPEHRSKEAHQMLPLPSASMTLPQTNTATTFSKSSSSAQSPVFATSSSSHPIVAVTGMDSNPPFALQSPADIYASLTQLAQEQFEWRDLDSLRSRFTEDLEELHARQSEVDRAAKRASDQTAKVIALSNDILNKLEVLRKTQEERRETEKLRLQSFAAAGSSGHTEQSNGTLVASPEPMDQDNTQFVQDSRGAETHDAAQVPQLPNHTVRSIPNGDSNNAAEPTGSTPSEHSAEASREEAKEAGSRRTEESEARARREEELRKKLLQEQLVQKAQVEAKRKAHFEEAARNRERKAQQDSSAQSVQSVSIAKEAPPASLPPPTTISQTQKSPPVPPVANPANPGAVHPLTSQNTSTSADASTTNASTNGVPSQGILPPSASSQKPMKAQKRQKPSVASGVQNPVTPVPPSDVVSHASPTQNHVSLQQGVVPANVPASTAHSQTSATTQSAPIPQTPVKHQPTKAAKNPSSSAASSNSAIAPPPPVKAEQATPRVPKVAKPKAEDAQANTVKREQSLDYEPLPPPAPAPVRAQKNGSGTIPPAAASHPSQQSLQSSTTGPSIQSRAQAIPPAPVRSQHQASDVGVGSGGATVPSVNVAAPPQTSVPHPPISPTSTRLPLAPQTPVNKVSMAAIGNPPPVTPFPDWGSSPRGPPSLPSFADERSAFDNSRTRDVWNDQEMTVNDMGSSAWYNAPNTSGWELQPSTSDDHVADQDIRDNAVRDEALTPPREERVPQRREEYREVDRRSRESSNSRRAHDHYSPPIPASLPVRQYDHYSPDGNAGRRSRPSPSSPPNEYSAGTGYKRRERDEDRSPDDERYYRRPRVPSGDAQLPRRAPPRREAPRAPSPVHVIRPTRPITPPRPPPRTDVFTYHHPAADVTRPPFSNTTYTPVYDYDTRVAPPRSTDRYPETRPPHPHPPQPHPHVSYTNTQGPSDVPPHENDLLARLQMAKGAAQRSRGPASIPLSTRIQDDEGWSVAMPSRPPRGRGRGGSGRGGGNTRQNRSLANRISS